MGHFYVTMWKDGKTEEYAFPARLGSIVAIDQAKRIAPDWSYITVTWRASFAQRSLPHDSQPSYGEINDEQDTTPLFHHPEKAAV